MILLFAFAAAIPELPTWALIAAIAVCAGWLMRLGSGAMAFYINGLWRLRWLFFAIAVLHLWRGGGAPVWDAMPGLTEQGLSEAVRRCAVLAALLGAVVVLVRSTPPSWLASGLIWCLSPLRALRFPVDRLGLRIALVFGAVDSARRVAAQRREAGIPLEDAAARLVLDAEAGRLQEAIGEIPAAGVPDRRSLLLMSAAVVVTVALYLI